jgi:transcriptional regulator with XRE-family HTH domain
LNVDPIQAGQDRRDLASALHGLRKASGLSGERLARRCGMSQSKVSRIETGRLLPSVVDVEQILTALAVDQATRVELMALARVANAEYHDVRASVRRGLHHRQREIAALESSASEVRHFLPTLITGLLQVPEYMRAAISTPVEPAAGDFSKALALKLERQAILHDASRTFYFLLTESAVRWRLCPPSVMAVQIDHLISISRLTIIHLGVLPLSAQVPDGPYHTFVVYDRRLVTIELFTGRLVLRDPTDIEHYRALHAFFGSSALWSEAARSMLSELANEFRAAG